MCTVCLRGLVQPDIALQNGETHRNHYGPDVCVFRSTQTRVRFDLKTHRQVCDIMGPIPYSYKITGELFASCPYDVTGKSVESVLDSSRYYVIRVESNENCSKRHAFIGIGVSRHTRQCAVASNQKVCGTSRKLRLHCRIARLDSVRMGYETNEDAVNLSLLRL